jgi:RNA recognition motif-containing protein
MSKFNVSLRLYGELPTNEEIDKAIGIPGSHIWRKGDLISPKSKRKQQIDVWILNLTPNLDFDSTEEEINEDFLQAGKILREIASNIYALEKNKFACEIYISSVLEEKRRSLILPETLVDALSVAGLSINISFSVIISENK